MAKIHYQVAEVLPDWSRSYPSATGSKGDVLIFKYDESYQVFDVIDGENGIDLKYRFDIKQYLGNSGPSGSSGQSRSAVDPIAIPAIHFGDTEPNINSTYWIKGDNGIWEKVLGVWTKI